MNGPLLISREGLHDLAENIINAASSPQHVGLVDAFLGTRECGMCHRRWEPNNIRQGVCFICRMRMRGSLKIAKMVCKPCRGENHVETRSS